MNLTDLAQHYSELIRDLKSVSYTSNAPEELSRIAYTSDSLRIFLIGNVKTQSVSIQVELSPSLNLFHDESSNSIYKKELEKQADFRKVIERLISNLKYLLRLNDNGFTLGLIGEDECLWFAEKILETEPNDELYKTIFSSPCQ